MRGLRRAATTCCAALWLCACGMLPQPPASPALHDFGLPVGAPAVTLAGGQVAVAPVSSPSWLANSRIRYRLLFDEPARLRAYAQNEWIAPPAELMTARLRLAFGNPDFAVAGAPGEPAYRLEVELLDFEQVFDTAHSARSNLRAVVSLRSTKDGRVLGPRLFDVSMASSPSVRGAIDSGGAAVERLVAQIVLWADGFRPAAMRP